MADMLECCRNSVCCVFLSLAFSFHLFTHPLENQIFNHFLNDRIALTRNCFLLLNYRDWWWKKKYVRRRYCLIYHSIWKSIKERICRRQGRMQPRTFLSKTLCDTWLNISRNGNNALEHFLPHVGAIFHHVLKTCQKWIRVSQTFLSSILNAPFDC